MNLRQFKIKERKRKRAIRIRKKHKGTANRPRLSVVKTNKNIYAQLIDDEMGKTLACVSTLSKDVRGTDLAKKNKTSAAEMGKMIAEKAKGLNIREIVFDRGPFKYHGILKELADAARSSGLSF